MKKKSEWNEGFYHGVIAALLVEIACGDETVAWEMLRTCGSKEIKKLAIKEGDDKIIKLVNDFERSEIAAEKYRRRLERRRNQKALSEAV